MFYKLLGPLDYLTRTNYQDTVIDEHYKNNYYHFPFKQKIK